MHTLLNQFRPGRTIYLPGTTGEITALAQALTADPERIRGVNIASCPLPGMNAVDYAGLHPEARATMFLLPPAARASFAAGRVRIMPISYYGAAQYLAGPAGLHVAVVHVAPPAAGQEQLASVGIAADFAAIAWKAARFRIAFVNHAMPSMPTGPRIDLGEADLVVEGESPLIEIAPAKPDPVADAIARHVAALVPDAAALQVGIGSAPTALWRALVSHRGLRLRSGLASEDLLHLADSGALAESGHVAGIAAGTNAFYAALAERDLVRLADTFETHDWRAIGREDRFVAANSALEVDLFGQINLEWQGGRPVSGVGGAPDFAAAAQASPGGMGVTMLPATAKGGSISRIVAHLTAPTVSLPRNLADVIVTEHGVARLKGASLQERAEALIAIAAPEFRDSLAEDWRRMQIS
jgi:acyl-CoA hydrolase